MSHVLLSSFIDDFADDVINGDKPIEYSTGFEGFRLSPGSVILLGGAPGAGKTSFTMQCVVDALFADDSITACVMNVEMPPSRLMERQLSRLSDVSLTQIQNRDLSQPEKDRITDVVNRLEDIAGRLVFVERPFTLESAAEAMGEHGCQILILDYIQRIGGAKKSDDVKGNVDDVMDSLRTFATEGNACVIALSAVSRSRDKKGRASYSEGLSLASFRESSELEFGADDAYILAAEQSEDSVVGCQLRHLKSRYGQMCSTELLFNREHQRFTLGGASASEAIAKAREAADIAKLQAMEEMWGPDAL